MAMPGVERVPWLYDAYMGVIERFGLGRWRRWLAAGARGRVLDVGTGTGRHLPLFPAGTRVVGLEPWLPMLGAARRRAPRVSLVVGDAQALPFASGSFDTVTSGLVFCSVPDPLVGLAEVRRVLAPGGELRMLEHVRHPRRFFARLQDLGQPAWTWIAGGCYPNRDTEANVERAGFVIDRSSRRARGVMRRFVARPG
jgi:ubiquinone/menaquinone biosynthesis C-methylase UbiE